MSADSERRVEGGGATVEENVWTVFRDAVLHRPDDVAIVDAERGERTTYGEFGDRVAASSTVLAERGVGRRDRVALAFSNEPAFLYAFFGAIRIGAVPVAVNVGLSPSQVREVVADCGASLVVSGSDEGVLDPAISAAETLPAVDRLLVAGGDPIPEADVPVDSFDRAIRDASQERPPASVSGDDPAFQLYTSGSTGRPKGVVHDHAGTRWTVDVNRRVQLLDAGDRSLCAAPIYHKNTLIGAVKPLLAAGGSVVLLEPFEPREAAAAIEEHGVTCFRGVPAMFKMMLREADDLLDHDVSTLEWAVSGAGPLPAAVAREFEETFGAPLGQSYGMSECGPALLTPRWGVRKPECTGLPLPGVRTEIVEPDTADVVARGEVGELLVSSPGVGRYHDRPEAADEAFERVDGTRFLRTGDLAREADDGYVDVIGRVDDRLIVGGENLHPLEVEDRLERHPSVSEAAVVGVPHAVKGEAPVAFVVATGDVTGDELRSFAIERGPAYAHPRRVFVEEELPLSGTGKIDRDALARLARSKTDGGVG